MQYKSVTDMYEAAWLVANECQIEGVECIPLSEGLTCRFEFSGSNLGFLEELFLKKEAQVNVHAFRRAYGQVNSFIHEAKKNYDRELRRLRKAGSL